MSSSACPFCDQLFPISDLEWHANTHLVEQECDWDLELAHQIALAPTSPPTNLDIERNDADDSEYFQTRGSGTLSNVSASTSDIGEANIHEQISCLFHLQIRSTFHKVEGGLMPLLRRCLQSESGNVTSIITDHVDHFQSLKSEDAGFGCGWRNIQMLSSHLLTQRPEARDVVFGGSGFVPDIPSLQRWLEIAWERNFDLLGSSSFKNKVYGSRKWIGTTECATIFRSFGLRARIVDFGSKYNESFSYVDGTNTANKAEGTYGRGKRKTERVFGPMDKFLSNRDIPRADSNEHGKSKHFDMQRVAAFGASTHRSNDKSDPDLLNQSMPTKVGHHQLLMEWVWNYFADKRFSNSGNPQHVVVSEKTPLYFQHDGHSRTIVGIQVRHQHGMLEQYTLLILDPGHRTEALERSLRQNVGWQRFIKRGVHTLKKPQYQLCYVDTGIAHGEEMEQLKTLDSIYFES